VTDLAPPPETENLLPALQHHPRARGMLFLRVGVVCLTVAAIVSGAVAGYAYVFGDSGTSSGVDGNFASSLRQAATTTTTEPPTTTTLPKPTTTTLPKPKQPPMLALPPVPGGSMGVGAEGPEVQMYELRLKQLRFDPGPVDGSFDEETEYAVEAVQKLFGGERHGRIDEGVRFALATFRWPKSVVQQPEPDRTEIDLDRQVLFVYRNNEIVLISTTSTGNGEHFCGGDDGCQYAVTPPGKFAFDWHHRGWRDGSLGELYNPYYFNGGIAVHGYTSVPTEPASHGCARIPMHVAEYFPDLVFRGMPVYVLGTAAPQTGGGVGSAEAAAPPPPPPPPPTTAPAPVTVATAPPSTTPPKPSTPKPSAPPSTTPPPSGNPAPPSSAP
jgi:peptidoglycan hydrolase-like protein with peptidoglycan-binding domain